MLQSNSSLFAYIWTNCFKLTKFEAEKTTNISVYSLITHRRQNVRNKINVVFLLGGRVAFFQSRCQNGPRIQFCHHEIFSWTDGTKLLPPLIWPKHRFSVHFWAISSGCFWEKSTFAYTHFSRKTQLVVLSKKSTECTNKLAVNCFQKSTNYVVPLSSRNLAFVNRMIVTINHRNNYSSSLHSQLAGLCQLPQTTLPSQYLWILNESYKYCIRRDPENSSDTETRRFVYFARLDYLSIWLKSNKFEADKATSIQGKLRTIQNLVRSKNNISCRWNVNGRF